jgi:hypothetical protein
MQQIILFGLLQVVSEGLIEELVLIFLTFHEVTLDEVASASFHLFKSVEPAVGLWNI